MYSFLKAFLVLMKLLSLSQFYAPKSTMFFALFAWFARTMESPRLKQAKHATSAKHIFDWDWWTLSKCSDTNVVFQTTVFLIPVVSNNKRSSGTDVKTSDRLYRNCLYYRYVELRFC